MYFTYIIQSLKTRRYYVGHTGDLQQRLSEHALGKTKSISHQQPFVLVYAEEFIDKHGAYRRERQIKSYKGGRAFRELISSPPPLAGSR